MRRPLPCHLAAFRGDEIVGDGCFGKESGLTVSGGFNILLEIVEGMVVFGRNPPNKTARHKSPE